MNPSIQKLAQLMQERQAQREPSYMLLLGSSLSLTPAVRRAFAGTEDWEAFWGEMGSASPTSRKALLKEPLNALGLEPGYQAVARLAEAGYFNLILTLNVDDTLDNALKALPASEYRIWVHGEVNSREIAATLDRPTPRIKVVKLRGDINARKLPLTPKAQFEFPPDLENAVTRWLSRDTIVVGDLPFDDDVQRCLRSGDDELWCILPDEPTRDSFIMRAKRSRLSGEIITSADAEFNAFFTALSAKVLEEKVKERDRVKIYERSTISLAERLTSDEQPLDDSDYGKIAEEVAEERKEPDERLLSGEQFSPLDDSDYREIEEEIAEEMKELDERLLSSEQPSPLGNSDYEKIAKDITEEMRKEVEASQEHTAVARKEPEDIGDSGYREIAEEIAEERKREAEADQEYTAVATKEPEKIGDSAYREITQEIAEERKEPGERLLSDEQPSSLDDFDYKEITEIESVPYMSPSSLWHLLPRYPIAWFAIGVIIVVIITVLFFDPLCCVLEFRLTEATVALIGLLAVGVAGMTFSIAPPQIDKILKSLYGGVAVAFIIVVVVMWFLPPPSQESCFPTRVLTPTAAPVSTHTMTPTSTETPTNTPSPMPTPTLAARATRIRESVAILSPPEGEEVLSRTHMLR